MESVGPGPSERHRSKEQKTKTYAENTTSLSDAASGAVQPAEARRPFFNRLP